MSAGKSESGRHPVELHRHRRDRRGLDGRPCQPVRSRLRPFGVLGTDGRLHPCGWFKHRNSCTCAVRRWHFVRCCLGDADGCSSIFAANGLTDQTISRIRFDRLSSKRCRTLSRSDSSRRGRGCPTRAVQFGEGIRILSRKNLRQRSPEFLGKASTIHTRIDVTLQIAGTMIVTGRPPTRSARRLCNHAT